MDVKVPKGVAPHEHLPFKRPARSSSLFDAPLSPCLWIAGLGSFMPRPGPRPAALGHAPSGTGAALPLAIAICFVLHSQRPRQRQYAQRRAHSGGLAYGPPSRHRSCHRSCHRVASDDRLGRRLRQGVRCIREIGLGPKGQACCADRPEKHDRQQWRLRQGALPAWQNAAGVR